MSEELHVSGITVLESELFQSALSAVCDVKWVKHMSYNKTDVKQKKQEPLITSIFQHVSTSLKLGNIISIDEKLFATE